MSKLTIKKQNTAAEKATIKSTKKHIALVDKGIKFFISELRDRAKNMISLS